MWRDVMLMTLLVALNPFLLAIILLQLSRPRPVQNLLAYWVGCMITNVPIFLVPLLALHYIPSFAAIAQDLATPAPGASVKPIQIGAGVLAMSIAALIAVRHRKRQRKEAEVAIPVGVGGGNSSVLLLEAPGAPTSETDSRLHVRINTVVARLKAVIQRGLTAWENGNLWLAVLFGMGCVPSLTMVLLVDTLIVGSGAPLGMQIVVAVVFVLTMFIVLELALVSNWIAPERTQAVLRPLQTWSAAHINQILITLLSLVGVWNVVAGAGLV